MLRFPPKRILVPFDFSDTAEQAWRHARALAKRFDAELEAAYVEPWQTASQVVPAIRLTPRVRRDILAQLRRRLGDDAKLHVSEGDPVVVLLRLARTARPDLIVMGTHGRTGLELVWRGSVAEALVRLSPVPVLVARGRPLAIRSILAPVNFTDYAQFGLAYAAAAAEALGAGLTALHVGSEGSDANDRMELASCIARLPRGLHKGRVAAAQAQGDATEEIVRACARHGLVVVVAHRKSLVKDFVLGTTAERVLRHAPIPVLAVPAPRVPIPLSGWPLELAPATSPASAPTRKASGSPDKART